MMDVSLLLGFLAVALLAYAAPGPDWFVVLRSAARSRRDGLLSSLGLLTGLAVHTLAASIGVSALLLASAEAFTAVKIAGAVYLCFLGVRALQSAYRTWRNPHQSPEETPELEQRPASAVWAQAFAANVLNPKAALFFVAVLPQFVTPSAPVLPQILLLGGADIRLGGVFWSAFTFAVSHFRALLQRRRVRISLDAASGTALIGLGGALVLTSRSA
jgi:threonine/homoserine/homoserine lactone efflux protein